MGIMDRRLREKRQRTDEIIDGARRIFNSKGFANTTMNDIADSTELSRRTLYMYFKSKEELAIAVAASALDYLDEAFTSLEAGQRSAPERLRQMFGVYKALVDEDPGRFQFLVAFADRTRGIEADNESLLECRRALERIAGEVGQVLRQGLAEGSLSFREEPKALAATIIFMIHSSAEASFTYRGFLPQLIGHTMEQTMQNTLHIIESYINPSIKGS